MSKGTRGKSLSELSQEELRKTIREEIQGAIEDVIKDKLESRLSCIEEQLKTIANIQQTVSSLENSLTFASQRIDDLYKITVPDLAAHVQEVTSALAFRILDMDVHRRKWSITIQGLEGLAKEDEDTTRKNCVDLAHKLGLESACSEDFSACHRLKPEANAAIIARFKDLGQRNRWLASARKLKDLDDLKVSIGPDLPPVLRPLKTELLLKRKKLPPSQKAKSGLRYLRQWPYVELAVDGRSNIQPETPQATILHEVLDMPPLFNCVEPTGTAQQPT